MTFLKLAAPAVLLLLVPAASRADFRFTLTRRITAGASVAGDNTDPVRYYFQGQKLKIDSGARAALFDFDARTVTLLDNLSKTFAVVRFEELNSRIAGGDVETRESDTESNINGHNARLSNVRMDIQSAELQRMGSQLRLEMDVWLSRDVPGGQEVTAFYQRNMTRFPWGALAQSLNHGANPDLVASLAAFHRRVAALNGVVVLEVVKVKPVESAPPPRLSAAETTRIRDAIAALDAAAQKGGPDAQSAVREMGRLKALVRDDYLQVPPGGSLFEITLESLGFSADPIPEQVFALPQDFRQLKR